MHPQRNLIESAMQVVINEAKEEELHNNLRNAISKRYGIDPNHKDWKHVKSHESIRKYSENVYDMFSNQIDDTHAGASDQAYDKASYDMSSGGRGEESESETEFHERVDDMHYNLTKGK